MHHELLQPRQALNKAFLKVKPVRIEIEVFKANLVRLLDQINETESEEFHKNLVSDFLKKTNYDPDFSINTKGRNDMVIHNGKDAKSSVGVILETKKPTNRAEMLSLSPEAKSIKSLNVKSFQELVLYFLRERISHNNLEVKHLVVTNIYEWFVFDASVFEKAFAQNKALVKDFKTFEEGRLSGNTTDFFYKEIASREIEKLEGEFPFTYFDLRNYDKPLRNADKKDDVKLIALYKLLSPEHMLKLPFSNDSNSLDKRFYSEFLHIIGLTESKEGGKKLIGRNKEGERNTGSVLEDAIIQLDSLDKISRLDRPSQFGNTHQERLFSVALELTITWINRILFLKLLEAQLITYHKGDKSYSFLNLGKIKSYDDLNSLFFQVLARTYDERNEDVKKAFEKVPYLNSSLFEPTDIEHSTIFVSNLRDDKSIPIFSQTVLKDERGKRLSGEIPTLSYLFRFLDAYDFGAEGGEEIQEDNKTLINASVLGLIFEKINGYKEGSIFTPGFVTMYMSRETIRRAVVQKFNEAKGWNCKTFEELKEDIQDEIKSGNRKELRKLANTIINSLRIIDPAVGSGHFLVSVLNELIAIKSELRILVDANYEPFSNYTAEVVNDELIVTDEDGILFQYNPNNKESQRIQETLFHEKQTIIENCLFGVDINPNSVKICRLRLWIELLKNAYYKNTTELETLPNIDINIKCGNSLVSRFAIDADLSEALRKSRYSIDSYRMAVTTYRNAQNKEEKREMERLILEIRQGFSATITMNNPLKKRLDKLASELYHRFTGSFLFEPKSDYGNNKVELKRQQEQDKLESEIETLSKKIDEIKESKVYNESFEWRFEFPEVLNERGDFVGFDVVVGNPPYFSMSKIKDLASYFENAGYQTYSKGADIYCLFYELGGRLLRENGFLTYITSNSWLRAIYGEPLKKHFVQNFQPISLLNIEDIQIFEGVTVESNIITLQKRKLTSSVLVANLTDDYILGNSLSEYFESKSFDFVVPDTQEWFIGNQLEGKLKLKIESQSKQLKELDIRINFGIKTGYNEAFIIDEAKKDELVGMDQKNAEIIKPILRGRDLKKYSFEFNKQWAICTFPSLAISIKDYPEIENYFRQIGKKRLEQTGENGSRKKTTNKWFETQDSISYWRDFEKPKIVWGEISDKPKFAYDDEGYYAEATTFLMTGDKLKFLLAILNSKVSEWYFKLIGTTTGMGTNRWKKYKIELLPIKIPTESQEQEVEHLADAILKIKRSNPSGNTDGLESQIDQLVYEIYGLTEEEIKIVEGGEG